MTNPSSQISLEQAVIDNNLEMVRLLLKNGENPNHHKNFPLLHSVVRNNQLDLLKILLEYGADPEIQAKGSFYHPPLREAKSVEAIQLLLQYGARTNPELMGKSNFLIRPIERGETDIVREFIRIGVPVDSAELWNAAIKGDYYHQEMIPICKLLFEAGLDANLPLLGFGSPLIRAIHFRSLELVQLMIEYGANLQTTDADGYTPYEVAVSILEKKISKLIASHLQKTGLSVPEIQQPPSLSNVQASLKLDHSDLVQTSFYSSNYFPNQEMQLQTLMKSLQYSPIAHPFVIYAENDAEDGYEDWDESYQPPLSDYQVVFHPHDPRCFIMFVNWYDDFSYTTIYHLHVRCETKYRNVISQLFSQWNEDPKEAETNKEFAKWYKQYKHGHFYYDWEQNKPTNELIEIRDEAEMYYLESVRTIEGKFF